MTGYLLSVLAAIAAFFVAAGLVRFVFQRKFLGQKVVSLSKGSGNSKLRRQRGFVRSDAHKSRRNTAHGSGSIRKPWGW